MKVYLTGSNGLIGSAIYKKFLEKGIDVMTLGRNNCDFFLDLNYFDQKLLKDIQSESIFIHCAGITDEEIALNSEQAIRKSTTEFIKLAHFLKNSEIKKFIYVSSAHVYGDLNRIVDEDSKVSPQNLYGGLHYFTELYIRSLFEDHFIIRPNAVFGKPNETFKRWGLIPFSFPKSLLETGSIILKSHGRQERNFVSTETLANLIYDSLNKNIIGTRNAVGFNTMSVLEFAIFCKKLFESDSKKNYIVDSIPNTENYISNFKYLSKFSSTNEVKNLLIDHVNSVTLN